MEFSIPTAAITTLFSTFLSVTITLYLNRANKLKNLDDQLDAILKIALQYPYLESEQFARTWNDNRTSENEEYVRYDLYCTLLFNFFARLSLHFKYNKSKIDNYIFAKDWIRQHKDYWQNPPHGFENIDSYNKKFKQLINEYLS